MSDPTPNQFAGQNNSATRTDRNGLGFLIGGTILLAVLFLPVLVLMSFGCLDSGPECGQGVLIGVLAIFGIAEAAIIGSGLARLRKAKKQ